VTTVAGDTVTTLLERDDAFDTLRAALARSYFYK